MCGIVGYAGFDKSSSLNSAIEKIKHRGPDGSGAQYLNGVALGNTRLAIIDLSSKAKQPMYNYDRSLCITFNGEIYNFREVKKLLEDKYPFKSNSDTEVILYAYQEWGIKCLEKLRGMFAFVIYDRKKKLLFGARDRLGQKPLKYYFESGKFIFASEIKAILTLLDSKLAIDEFAIDDFLTLQYIPSPKTGFKKIYKLPPAHYFIYRGNRLSVHRYWSLNFETKLILSEDQWCDLVYREIEKSVTSHMVSDVPVGALLSGGLDSSIVVALMSMNTADRIHTFSIGFDETSFDETRYAKLVSDMYKTKHTQFSVTSSDLLKNVKNLAEIYDEPIGDNSILPTLLVSKLTSAKVKVALTGDGGDENFAGYDRYTFVELSSYISRFPITAKKVFSLIAKSALLYRPSKLSERMDRFITGVDEQFYRKYINYNLFFTIPVKRYLYSPDFKRIVAKNDTYKIYRGLYDKNLSDVDNALRIDISTYLPDDLLYKSDSASMAYGLELRAPLLDHILMEKVAAMPASMKLRLATKKRILKKIAAKNKLLPKEVIYRKKHGFTAPLNKWFKGPLKEYIYEQILSSDMTGSIFDKTRLKTYLDDYYRTNLAYDNNIFALLILSLWFDKYSGTM